MGDLSTGNAEVSKRARVTWARRLGAVALGVAAFFLVLKEMPKPLPELSRTEFLDEVRAGHVHQVAVVDDQVITGTSSTRGQFRTAFKSKRKEAALLGELSNLGVEMVFEDSGPGLI